MPERRSTRPPLTVAAVHAAPAFLDREASIACCSRWIAEAGRQGVDLLVFPEVFVPGFPYWINCYAPLAQLGIDQRYVQESVCVPGPEIDAIQKAAAKAGVAVVLGISEREGGTCYNSQVFVDTEGRLCGIHRKLQPTFAERMIWGQGDGSTLRCFEMDGRRVGGLICWEHTMNLARQALVNQGEEIHAASWPGLSTLRGFKDVFDDQVAAMCRNHALTAQCFVICAANPVTPDTLQLMEELVGPQDWLEVGGGWSAVMDPMARVIAGPHTGLDERLVVAEVDLAQIVATKLFVDGAGHYARREVLELRVDATPHSGWMRILAREGEGPQAKTGAPARSGGDDPAGIKERRRQ